MEKASCKNCGNLKHNIVHGIKVYFCDAFDIFSNILWVKVETGSKPNSCDKWVKATDDEAT